VNTKSNICWLPVLAWNEWVPGGAGKEMHRLKCLKMLPLDDRTPASGSSDPVYIWMIEVSHNQFVAGLETGRLNHHIVQLIFVRGRYVW